VEFDRSGHVSFTEWSWFTRTSPPDANLLAFDFEAADSRGRDASTDEVVTLNMPLLGVLATVDRSVGTFKRFAELAVQQFFDREALRGTFEGLFMRRCVSVCCTAVHAAPEAGRPVWVGTLQPPRRVAERPHSYSQGLTAR
jgi:hypothetical protein